MLEALLTLDHVYRLAESEIESRVQELRTQLLASASAGTYSRAEQKNLRPSDVHALAAAKERESENFAKALNVKADYRSGDAFDHELQEKLKQERIQARQEAWEKKQREMAARQEARERMFRERAESDRELDRKRDDRYRDEERRGTTGRAQERDGSYSRRRRDDELDRRSLSPRPAAPRGRDRSLSRSPSPAPAARRRSDRSRSYDSRSPSPPPRRRDSVRSPSRSASPPPRKARARSNSSSSSRSGSYDSRSSYDSRASPDRPAHAAAAIRRPTRSPSPVARGSRNEPAGGRRRDEDVAPVRIQRNR